MRIRKLTFIVLALAGASTALASDNLVPNGSFATDLADWQASSGTALWLAESAYADGTGSAQLTSDYPGSATAFTVLTQCIAVSPGAHFLQFAARVPTGQQRTGHAYSSVYVYGTTTCDGAPIGSGRSTASVSSGTWSFRGVSVNVPAGGLSVSLRLDVYKLEPGGIFDVVADAVELRTGFLFADGLESGSTALWSAVVP